MRWKIITLVSVGAVVIAVTGSIWENVQKQYAAEALLANVAARRAQVDAAFRGIEARLVAAEQAKIAWEAELERLREAEKKTEVRAAGKKVHVTQASVDAQLNQKYEERLKDPQVQLLQLAAARAKLTMRYEPLYRALGLSQEKREKFEENKAKRDEGSNDVWSAIASQGISWSDPEFGKLYGPLVDKIDQAYRAAQRELLGDEGYRQWETYERTNRVRDVVGGLAGAATMHGAPWSGAQAEQLVNVLARASVNYGKGYQANTLDIDWSQVDQEARTILSEEQLAVFKTSEPSGGAGGRHWAALNKAVNDAAKTDAKKAATPKAPGGGG